MKKLCVKIFTLLMCFSLLSSFTVVSVSASVLDALDVIGETNFKEYISMGYFSRIVDAFFNGTADDDHGAYFCSTYWAQNNNVLVTESSLDTLSLNFNTQYGAGTDYTLIKSFCGDTGCYGLKIYGSSPNPNTVCWLADNSGRAILAEPDNETDAGIWLPIQDLRSPYKMLSYGTLYNLANEKGGVLRKSGEKYFIFNSSGTRVFADKDGLAYTTWEDPNQAAINQPRPDTSVKDENGDPATDEEGNIIQNNNTDNSTNIDLSNMTITLPDGMVLVADQIIYDESTKTYNIDSHDTTNYNYTYYYTWNYYINYTSITYIGTTEEYNKYYEVYYELPDGRDSADLTAEEVEQLNVSIDVIPYGRSADDTSLRSLYHFDGDTKDSSYWNYCTDFTWITGASLTYMDSATFGGALYLDETEHYFTLTLPSNITSGDFTFQFRYYQSYTAAPQTDSYISFDSTPVLWFDGANMKYGSSSTSTTELSVVPVGSWNEIALIRSNSTLYYYLNGVCVGSVSDHTGYGSQITFYFGADQQTYKQLDEMRFVNQALASGGVNYTCTSVPYDSNLTLVLPDSQTAVADEYWDITHTDGYLDYFDFSTGAPFEGLNQQPATTPYIYQECQYPLWGYVADDAIDFAANSAVVNNYLYTALYRTRNGTFYLPSGTYTASLILADGRIETFTFQPNVLSEKTFTGGEIAVYQVGATGNTATVYALRIKVPAGLVGIEIVEGTTSNVSAKFVSSVTIMDKEDLNTPTLAVRTDLDITSYQIGGVRPSIPSKGLVWALVESGYITSLQIYNGSAWEACDGRIWTGERWIPVSSYNIITLKDMYDIVDSTQNYEYIYTESGFWSWWQKSWNAFTEKLFSVLGSGGSGSSGSGSITPSTVLDTVKEGIASLISGVFTLITEVLKVLIGAVMDLLTGIFGFLTETVLGGIKDFFSFFTDGSLFDVFQQTDEDGNVFTDLPTGIRTVFVFFSGLFMLIPSDLRLILVFGIGLMLFLAVVKIVKE